MLLLLCSCVVGQLTFGRRASFAFGGEERGEALDGGGGGVLAMMVVDAVGDDAGQGGGGGGHDSGSGGRHGSCRSNGFVQPMQFKWGRWLVVVWLVVVRARHDRPMVSMKREETYY